MTYFETGSLAACNPRAEGVRAWGEFVAGYLKPACERRFRHPYFGADADELLKYMIGEFELLPERLYYTPPNDFPRWVDGIVWRRGPAQMRRERGVRERPNPVADQPHAPPGTPATVFVVDTELPDDHGGRGDDTFLELVRRENAERLAVEIGKSDDRELRVSSSTSSV
jgi:hypothetical protein